MLGAACSSNDHPNEQEPAHGLQVEKMNISVQGMEADDEVETRAVGDFRVNRAGDPTNTLTTRTGWTLHVHIFDDVTPYDDGEGYFTWTGTDMIWETTDDVYFPNYLKQGVEAELYPGADWNVPVETDQSTADNLLEQDILEQDADDAFVVNPAHIPELHLRHARSMLDFILVDIDESQLASVTVIDGATVYQPYRVDASDFVEYMVILPLNVTNPKVRVVTNEGADYTREITIASTEANKCYCVKLRGLELLLSTITVSSWQYGEGIGANYSTVASYPTFRGIPNATVTIYYNNGLDQTITFNDRGEYTAKPYGRTIVNLLYNGQMIDLTIPLVLSSMIIDLTNAMTSGL